MKAIVYRSYGGPDVLRLEDVPVPSPKQKEVLIRVAASSINSWDWDMVRGRPYINRMWGLTAPRYTTPGADISGTIEAVGEGVTNFQYGDEVYGDLCECGWGAYAEFVCAPESALTLKPKSISFEEAAAVPQAGTMAFQSLYEKCKVAPGEKVLINGGGGGVGSFAIQLCKTMGAEIHAVDSEEKFDMMKKLGADFVYNFLNHDFTREQEKFDHIIDMVASRSVFKYKARLKDKGNFVMIGGSAFSIIQAMALGRVVSSSKNKKVGILMYRPNNGLDAMANYFDQRQIIPEIDRSYSLESVSEAMRYFQSGKVKGKVVISINSKNQ